MHILLAQFYSSQPTPDYDKIAAELRGRGHTVWVGTPNEAGDVQWHDGRGIAATQKASGPSRLPRPLARRLTKIALFRRVRGFIRQSRPDIVQVNAFDLFRFLPVGMPRRSHFILDVRQINEQHGAGAFGRLKAALQNKSRALYSRFIFEQTTFLHQAGARQVLGERWARRATVVPMGVDPQFLAAGSQRAAAPHRAVDFIYIGRLTRRRQLERILEAAVLVRRQSDRFRVVFMGYDASEGFYAETIRRLGLEDRVTIRPPIPYEQVPEAVLAHDVALAYVPELPADWQYHPTLKILEYRALGMPIIATDFPPNHEFVVDGVNGLLVQNTAERIAAAMLRFVCEPEFLNCTRVAAGSMREGLTWDRVATQYLALYERLWSNR
jgi:glycosyltransferase involved in cell wall biosynthesis